MLMALRRHVGRTGSGTESEAEAVSGQRQGIKSRRTKRQTGPIS